MSIRSVSAMGAAAPGLSWGLRFAYSLPPWLRQPKEVFRVDADGVHDTRWKATATGVEIEDSVTRDAVYIATSAPAVRSGIKARHQSALAREVANPA